MRASFFVAWRICLWASRMTSRRSFTNGTVVFTGSTGGQAMSDAGRRTSCPNMAIFGVTPVTRCTVIQYAAMTVGSLWGQLSGVSSAVHLNICSNVVFIRSVWLWTEWCRSRLDNSGQLAHLIKQFRLKVPARVCV